MIKIFNNKSFSIFDNVLETLERCFGNFDNEIADISCASLESVIN